MYCKMYYNISFLLIKTRSLLSTAKIQLLQFPYARTKFNFQLHCLKRLKFDDLFLSSIVLKSLFSKSCLWEGQHNVLGSVDTVNKTTMSSTGEK